MAVLNLCRYRPARRRRASSMDLSSSSDGITSGPFASAAAFAVIRRRGYMHHRHSRSLEGVLLPPPARNPPPDCNPSHLRCSPRPFPGWGRTSELSWGPFCLETCFGWCTDASGRLMSSQDVHFSPLSERESGLFTSSHAKVQNPTETFRVFRYQVRISSSPLFLEGAVLYLALWLFHLAFAACSEKGMGILTVDSW